MTRLYLSIQVCVASTVSMAGRPSVSERVTLSIDSTLNVRMSRWPTSDIFDCFVIVSDLEEPTKKIVGVRWNGEDKECFISNNNYICHPNQINS